jgi:hypothetical protein
LGNLFSATQSRLAVSSTSETKLDAVERGADSIYPTMVSTIIILAISATTLGLAWSLLFRNSQPRVFTFSDWEQKRREVDVRVFNCLVDVKEDQYLAFSLPHGQFTKYQRERTRLALRLLALVKENADMLIRLGALARTEEDRELAREAEDLMVVATQLRLNLLLAKYCLWLKWLFPGRAVSVPSVEPRYQNLLQSFLRMQQHNLQS